MLTQDNIEHLVEKYQLDLLVLFGSHARGRARAESDLDIAFLSKQPMNDQQWDEMMTDLMRLTHKNRVDLIDLKRQRGALLHHQIFTTGKVLYESSPRLFQKKKIDAVLFYADYRPIIREYQDRLLGRYIATHA